MSVEDVSPSGGDSKDDFPTAVIANDSSAQRWLSRSTSWLLLLALGGLLTAVAFAWFSATPDGTEVTVFLPDGFGLKEEDAVRYRGISVGQVTDVRLADDLKGVVVEARLVPSASELARKGSIFWVERPQVSLAGVRSLDTLVGGRYLSVIPGPEGTEVATEFIGEVEPPAVLDPVEGGLPITLLSEERFGLERGSVMSYRGLTAGQVLQVALAESGHKIEVHAVIFPEYAKLVRENTEFWSRSGVDVKIGLKGVDMDLDPATALSKGAIAFATPLPAGNVVKPGKQFELAASESEGWQDWKPILELTDAIRKRRKEAEENGEAPKRPLLQRLRDSL